MKANAKEWKISLSLFFALVAVCFACYPGEGTAGWLLMGGMAVCALLAAIVLGCGMRQYFEEQEALQAVRTDAETQLLQSLGTLQVSLQAGQAALLDEKQQSAALFARIEEKMERVLSGNAAASTSVMESIGGISEEQQKIYQVIRYMSKKMDAMHQDWLKEQENALQRQQEALSNMKEMAEACRMAAAVGKENGEHITSLKEAFVENLQEMRQGLEYGLNDTNEKVAAACADSGSQIASIGQEILAHSDKVAGQLAEQGERVLTFLEESAAICRKNGKHLSEIEEICRKKSQEALQSIFNASAAVLAMGKEHSGKLEAIHKLMEGVKAGTDEAVETLSEIVEVCDTNAGKIGAVETRLGDLQGIRTAAAEINLNLEEVKKQVRSIVKDKLPTMSEDFMDGIGKMAEASKQQADDQKIFMEQYKMMTDKDAKLMEKLMRTMK